MVKKRFEALDAFRGLCALSVVVYHMHLVESITELDFFRGSSIFVEFFFVLSGFVLTHGYGFKDNLNFNRFMKARFFRIYPLHFFMFLVFFLLQVVMFLAFKFTSISSSTGVVEPFTGRNAISEILPNLLLLQSWTPFTSPISFNGPSWSISIEFYLYALLFLSIAIFQSNRVISWFCISSIAFFLIIFGSDILTPQVLMGGACFFGGAFTYTIYKKISHLNFSFIAGSVIEIALIISVILIVQSTIEHQQILAPFIFFLTVLFFTFESGCCSKILKTKPFQYMGKLSYSIYMTHAAILTIFSSSLILIQKISGYKLVSVINGDRYLDIGGGVLNNVIILFFIVITIYISSLTHKYIELKGQKLNKNKAHISLEENRT